MTSTVDSITRKGAYEPFDLQVARGHVFGHQPWRLYGYSATLGSTAFGPLWEGLTASGGAYAYPGSAAQLTLVSSSTSDTSALRVLISGLDANFNPISETLALNGTTNVTSVNSYLRVNSLAVTNGTNVGVITAKIGTTLYAQINAGVGTTQMSQYTVPAGWQLVLNRVKAYANVGFTSSAYNTYQRYQENNIAPDLHALRLTSEGVFVQELDADYRDAPVIIQSGTDLQLQFKASTGTSTVASVTATGVLIQADQPDNSYPL
jgi:hypothetical protein